MSSSASNISAVLIFKCANSVAGNYIIIAISVVRGILILPLCILVLYLGLQRWQRQRSFKTTSHSDIFTYHMAATELIWGLGCLCYLCGKHADHQGLMLGGIYAANGVFYGATYFHLLTCVERYLAVVHPITYLSLKNVNGVWLRYVSTGCVWLLCFGWMGITALYLPQYPTIPFVCFMVVCLTVVSFCSLSILCILIRPGPGEGGDERERVDQSKLRAFHTITAIAVVLWLWFGGLFVTFALEASPQLSDSFTCIVISSVGLLNLPCTLVLPLLFLQRAGKLSCCRRM